MKVPVHAVSDTLGEQRGVRPPPYWAVFLTLFSKYLAKQKDNLIFENSPPLG